jgi:hypothetical protein
VLTLPCLREKYRQRDSNQESLDDKFQVKKCPELVMVGQSWLGTRKQAPLAAAGSNVETQSGNTMKILKTVQTTSTLQFLF